MEMPVVAEATETSTGATSFLLISIPTSYLEHFCSPYLIASRQTLPKSAGYHARKITVCFADATNAQCR